MTKSNLKLASSEPLRNDDRAALAAAIADKRRADAAVEAARARLAHADERITASTAALEVATAEVAKVKARAIAAATGSARDMGAQVLRAARAAQTDAADAVEIAQGARDQIAASLPDLEASAAWAQNAVITAANALLAPEAARLLEETRELRMRLALNQTLLTEMFHDSGGPEFKDAIDAMRARDERDLPLKQLKEDAGHFLMMMINGTIAEQRVVAERIATWWQARKGMWSDADAPLPVS